MTDEIEDRPRTRSRTPSVDTQSYTINEEAHHIITDSDSSSSENEDGEGNETNSSDDSSESGSVERFLDEIVPTTSTSFIPNDTPDPATLFDITEYIFDSIVQSTNACDFSEAFALQAKTSAVINSKSMELKNLIEQTKVRLPELQAKFKNGTQTLRTIRKNLDNAKSRIQVMNDVLQTDYPIEFNQARDKILERTLDSDEEVT